MASKLNRGRVLVVSYAFPPMQTQMAPIVVKPMAALARSGFEVDVICAEPFSGYLGSEPCLLPYIETHFPKIVRLPPPSSLLGKLRIRLPFVATTPDLMVVMKNAMYRGLMDMDLGSYDAIVTWSPFHSINNVMVQLGRHRPGIPWVAQFSDPWAGNPLERNAINRMWSERHEPRAVAAAKYVIHSSSYSLNLMKRRYPGALDHKSALVVHPFEPALFPDRPKTVNSRITLRYVGVLFDRRSPEPLFGALKILLERRPELQEQLCIELVGGVPPVMLETPTARSLPQGMVRHVKSVSYLSSLEKMYDADILLLIDADVTENLFVPSKLSDYIGAGVPIVGITPPGGAWDILERLDCWRALPGDVCGIASALESAIDYVASGRSEPWCDEEYCQTFSSDSVAKQYQEILSRI